MEKKRLLEKIQANNLTHWEKAPAGYWNGTGLNKLESCAYYAVLSSLTEEELHQALDIIRDWPHSSEINVPFPVSRTDLNQTKIIRFASMKRKAHTESEMVKAVQELESGIDAETVARIMAYLKRHCTIGRASTAAWR